MQREELFLKILVYELSNFFYFQMHAWLIFSRMIQVTLILFKNSCLQLMFFLQVVRVSRVVWTQDALQNVVFHLVAD